MPVRHDALSVLIDRVTRMPYPSKGTREFRDHGRHHNFAEFLVVDCDQVATGCVVTVFENRVHRQDGRDRNAAFAQQAKCVSSDVTGEPVGDDWIEVGLASGIEEGAIRWRILWVLMCR